MESLQQLDDSLSYRWLLNLKIDALDGALRSSFDEGSFIEMDPRIFSFRKTSQDLDFDFPSSQPLALVHADQIFSNGLIVPLHLLTSPSKTQNPVSSETQPMKTSNVSSESFPRVAVLSSRQRTAFLQKCQRSSKKLVRKYLGFLRPFCRKVRGRISPGGSKSVNWSESLPMTPRTSSATTSAGDWCRSNLVFDDIENPIYEAVLHCKNSIENQGKE